MFPAARIGDPITHDMLVPCGVIGPQAPAPCPNCSAMPVIIEGLPAAHVLCTCVCTGVITGGIVHPPVPGPQPPIVKGSLTVSIHNMPAARWVPSLDVAACGVFLGMPPMAATRTVLIGDVGGGLAALMVMASSVNPASSVVNCGNIIDAVNARMTGTDPSAAAPAGRDGSFTDIEARFGTHLTWGGNFQDAFNAVQAGGNGTRAIVGIGYSGGGGSHVVMLTNSNGTVGIVEGQDWGAGNPREVVTTPARANARYNSDGGSNIGWGLVP